MTEADRFAVVIDPGARAAGLPFYFLRDGETGNLIGPWSEWADADTVCQAENQRVEREKAARWLREHQPVEAEPQAALPADGLEGDAVWHRGPGEPRYIAMPRKMDGMPYILDRTTKLVKGPFASWEDADRACASLNAEEARGQDGGQEEERRGALEPDGSKIERWLKRGIGRG
jgi:hypothetical protein